MIAAACILFTVLVLVYVFYVREPEYATPEKTRLAYLLERKDVVYENLRDLNFEFKAGKFPERDYFAMRDALEAEAAQVLAEIDDIERSQMQGAHA
ncbi:MAG TPA: hypothetical protein VNK82_02655 [Terriglobales bacterium]|nr:hypothetical protein [Terriglobales bacterium]